MPTQLQYAISGEITPEMKAVANHEKVDKQWLCQEIAQGRIVIPKNTNHHFEPRAIGSGLTTKINANLGTSEKHCNLKEELEKMKIAVKHGADAIMDLSTGGDLRKIVSLCYQ